MQFEKFVQRMDFLNELVSKESTGSPEQIATRLGISRRMFFEYLSVLKEKKGFDIKYCRRRQTYYYSPND